MTTQQLQDYLVSVIDGALIKGDGFEQMSVTTFEDAGIFTYNKGLMICTEKGEEFQLILVQSR